MFRGIRSRLSGLVLAAVVPFAALVGVGLSVQWHSDQAAAIERAVVEARLLAAQVDDHIGNLDNLLMGLSRAVSTNPADTTANDALLRQVKGELPRLISNVFLFSPDGTNIGIAEGERFYGGDRSYFRDVVLGKRLAIGQPLRGRAIGQWVITLARPIMDRDGRLQAVLAVGTLLEHFQDALRIRQLPTGSVVRIVSERGLVIAQSDDAAWIGRDLSNFDNVARHIGAREASEITIWQDNVERITGSSTAHLAPWLVSVGLPRDIAFAAVSSRLAWSALFSAATLLIALLFAWVLSTRIVRPLRQLGSDARILAAGDLGHRTQVDAADEIGILAGAFNNMAGSLQRRQEDADRAAVDLRQAKDTLAAVIDASPVAIVCSDPVRRIVLWNRSAEQIFGHTAEEAIGQLTKLVPPEGIRESQELFDRAINGETTRDVQVKRLRKDGSMVDVRLAAAPMYHPDGTARGVAWAYEDITDRKKAEARLHHLAHYDSLTGLPNRLTLKKQLTSVLGQGKPTAVVLFDLDGFKDVNDTLGHSTGDQLLVEVGRRLGEAAGDRGLVCRLGGDEFVVIIPDCGDPLAVAKIVESMLQRLAEPYDVNDHIVHLAGSAGIAMAPNDGEDADELIANADLALYQAKNSGGCVCRFFLPVLRAQAQARRRLDADLRRAFAENEFELYFQPQLRIADETIIGAEALLRWRHPVKGILLPGAFIDTLAESSSASTVGRWIIQTACSKTAAWRAMGLPLGRIAVNLFPAQLRDDGLLKDIDDALRETGLLAENLEIEITENIALEYERAEEILHSLHERGVKLASDDFGTGYASLSYLTKFPFSRIKIDCSFMKDITENVENAAIVRSLISMARNLGLKVIAEGIETREQATFLLNERCEEAQGFLYSKPLSAAEFETFLRMRRLESQEPTANVKPLFQVAKVQGAAGESRRRRRTPKA